MVFRAVARETHHLEAFLFFAGLLICKAVVLIKVLDRIVEVWL